MAPFNPTPEQEAVLRHAAGRHARVLAGPGTGKSATVIAWLTNNSNLRAKLLTFTRAATAELVQKLAQREDVVIDKPSTVHAFCISVLLSNPSLGEMPRPLRMADDWESDQIVEPTLASRLQIGKRTIGTLFKELAANWESLDPAEIQGIDPQVRARFVGGWRQHRAILGYSLLAELPFALRTALRDHPDLRGVDYEMLVVDEYQDLNACDLDVLRRIAGRGCKIFAVGDDDQSIYSFRKAHPAGIRRFTEEYDAADYPLTITRRCARRIVQWANYVIQGDVDRPVARPALRAADIASEGTVALLAFPGHVAEARGIARLTHHLIEDEGLPASEILILLRSDHNGQFSGPIKEELARRNIPFSDPSEVSEILADNNNRKALSILRIAAHREDSLAWASLLHLTPGIGSTFFSYVYDRARDGQIPFARALLLAHNAAFVGVSQAVARRARTLVANVLEATRAIAIPPAMPNDGWGQWILERLDELADVIASPEFKELLAKVDARIEPTDELGRYLGQIGPVAKDIALEKNISVRIMTLTGSKGLTVKATIIAGLETGMIPMDDCDPAEERRLLYVGMTRAEEYLFGTWARRRRGPTARMGRAQVNARRQVSMLVDSGPVESEDGNTYLDQESSV